MRIDQFTTDTGVSEHTATTVAAHSTIARVGLWSALAFMWNLPWEITHIRLYTDLAAIDGGLSKVGVGAIPAAQRAKPYSSTPD
jgi:hypothetical protein